MAIEVVDRLDYDFAHFAHGAKMHAVRAEALLAMVRRASGRERDLAVELWTWLFNPGERAAIRAIAGVETLRDLAPPLSPGLAALGIAVIGRLPPRLRYSLPLIQVLEARFRAASAH
jgi:hypothetical protein